MTARSVVALAWSLITGLVGGWLMLTPWSLGELTPGGGWTSVARTEFFSGLGLVLLSGACLAVVAVQVVRTLTDGARAGVAAGSQTERGGTSDSLELESTLVAVAQALTADLMSKGPARGEELDSGRRDRAVQPAESADGRREES